jgi:hypothetical protein
MATENKKISEMTTEEIRAKMVPVGLPSLPYPMAMLKKNEKGVMTHDVGVIESAQNPLLMYTDQSIERVNGLLFRQMPIPGMMLMLRDLLTKIAPESKNRIMTVFGDAAFGKSHLFKLVGNMVHPQGPISVDCGGMNMREIFFRTVIDYGQGVKEQFEKRVADGKISQVSMDNLNAAFPGSIIEKDGKRFVDWEAIGKPRQKDDGKGTMINDEDRGDAQARGAMVLKSVYDKEGIDVQSNAFGIKTVPGEWFESIWTGRPLFLDEFNKSKKGTLDSFQTALQFANGEIDEVTLYNPMAQAGDGDSPKSITVKREDLRMGWHVGVAGNDSTDGDTTQEISVSMETRLNPMRIGDPEQRDWAHRISQIWTGLPLVTLYNMFEKKAKADPVGFSDFLVELRQLGLTASERKAIPPHELYFLRNYQETVQAVNQVTKYYDDRLQLSDPASEKYNQKEYKDLSDEVSANGKNIFVSFRKAIADFNKAIQATPEVRPATEATLSLNLAEVFKTVDLSAIGRVAPGWHKFGTNMVRAIQEDIANDTIGMPLTNAALITLCETNGIFPPNLKEAKPSKDKDTKPLSDLLRYDPLKDLGGTEELSEIRGVLMACLKNLYPTLKKEDDYVIPLDALGRAMKELQAQTSPPKAFVVPNGQLDLVEKDPILMGQALPNYLLDDPANSPQYNLVDFRTVLAALAVPEYAKGNRAHIWPIELDDYLPDEVKKEAAQDKSQAEALNSIKGKSAIGFDLMVVSALNEKKQQVFMYVIEDKVLDKVMVVGPEPISKALASELSKNGLQYVVKDDEASVTTVNEFLADGAKERGKNGKLVQGNTQNVIEGLIKAFSALCELADVEAGATPDQMTVNKGSTLGLVIHRSKSRPVVFTSIVTPKTGTKR